MNLTIIGIEPLAVTLAEKFALAGHRITLSPLDMVEAEQSDRINRLLQKDLTIDLQPIEAGIDRSETILFAFPWYQLIDVSRIVGKLEKKVIIDTINPISSSGSLSIGHKWSAGEEIQQTFPLAYVVKGFNHLYVDHINNPDFGAEPISAFYCSNHDQAKSRFAQLAQELRFDPVDVGPIKHARYIEPLATLWLQMAFHIGMGPDIAFTLARR